VEFDGFTVALLLLGSNPPALGDEEANALQDAHLAHLAELHDAGHLLAAGPLMGGPDGRFRGLSIFRSDPELTRELCDADPAVRAGRFVVEILPWMVPGGAIDFSPTRFPRSIADATGD
jgi:uncharacterized protein YciI